MDVPPSLHRGGVAAEAEFFCITDFVEALAQEDREREEREQQAALENGLSTMSSRQCTSIQFAASVSSIGGYYISVANAICACIQNIEHHKHCDSTSNQ